MSNQSNDDDDKPLDEASSENSSDFISSDETGDPSVQLIRRDLRYPMAGTIGNIKKSFIAPEIGSAEIVEAHYYDVNSRMYLSTAGGPVSDPVYLPASPNRIPGITAIHYRFKKNGQWGSWYDSGWFRMQFPPVILSPTQDKVYISGDIIVEGNIAEPASYLQLIDDVLKEPLAPPLPNVSSGKFRLSLSLSKQGRYRIFVRQASSAAGFLDSDVVSFSVIHPPIIWKIGDGSAGNKHPEITGAALQGCTIDVYIKGTSTYVLKDVPVHYMGLWSAQSKYTFETSGTYTLVARQRLRETVSGEGPGLDFSYFGPPNILGPEPLQDQSFLLQGNNGLQGAELKVYPDQENSPIYGSGTVTQINGSWAVQVSGIPPGPVSLVAEQIFQNIPSGRGPARLFKIRPPQLESIAINVGLDGQITFKGKGSPRAIVEIFAVSGPDASPIPPVPVVDGKWEATATDWPLGTYGIQYLQRVPDGANGWIVSHPSATEGFTKLLPDVDKVDFTPVYQPTFSGLGYPGATVKLIDPESQEPVAPDAPVSQQNREWSSLALAQWGPGNRRVHVKQYLDGHESPKWVALDVNIPPLEPTVEEPSDDGISPTFTGTCWPAARVEVSFSDDDYSEICTASVIGERWTFSRQAPFDAGVIHTIRAIQTFAGQSSEPASRTFSVYWELLQPVIESPLPDEETDSALTVTGDNGMSGASMQLWDARDKKPLGNPVILAENGPWSIALSGLAIDRWFISAQQTLNNRLSEHSDIREFNVVIMPPEFLNPLPGSNLPRTSSLSGKGRTGALVTVWCKDIAEPLLRDVPVGPKDVWDHSVTLAVGDKVFWATQTFEGKTSKPSLEVACRFVPHAVLPESPTPEEQLGNTVTVSGFAVPGDQITLMRGPNAIGQARVLPEGTWSITATLAPPDGAVTLSTVASCDEFASAPSEWVSQVGLYLPAFTKPEAGHWVSPLVMCTGLGKPGVGKLMSWYSPDVVLAASVTVTPAGWRAQPAAPFASGTQWCRFEQTFSTGTPISDCSESGRFDVRVESSGDS
jgi:hypothetical protein